ncbi:MAG: hypothetical protein JNK27_12125 [Chitinophagaceae bacterium]|nr:hypothetical protein [Chitinophagaceae bacterium]
MALSLYIYDIMRIPVFLLAVLLFVTSCSKTVLEAAEDHKLHETYLLLRKNGHYSFKVLALGVFRLPDHERGHYILSGDSVYFVTKTKRNVFALQAYGLIDSSSHSFFYRPVDSLEWKTFDIGPMPTRRRDREMKKQD